MVVFRLGAFCQRPGESEGLLCWGLFSLCRAGAGPAGALDSVRFPSCWSLGAWFLNLLQ